MMQPAFAFGLPISTIRVRDGVENQQFHRTNRYQLRPGKRQRADVLMANEDPTKKTVLKFDKAIRPPRKLRSPKDEQKMETSKGRPQESTSPANTAKSPERLFWDPQKSTLKRQPVPQAAETGEKVLQRRRKGPKKVSKAAAAQQSMSFADAWSVRNRGKIDIWFVIGLLAIVTPFAIICWAIQTGVIPTGGAFD